MKALRVCGRAIEAIALFYVLGKPGLALIRKSVAFEALQEFHREQLVLYVQIDMFVVCDMYQNNGNQPRLERFIEFLKA